MLTLVDALGSFKYSVADAITVGVTAHNSVGSGTRATFTGVTARDVPKAMSVPTKGDGTSES